MAASLYLYSGPEIGERNDAAAAVKKALKDKFGSLESYSYYSVETDPQSALVPLYSESLFSAATCVVYNGAEAIKKKEDVDKIAAWAKGAGEASVLILLSDEISCDSKLEKIVPKENRRQFWEMFDDRKIPWLKNYFSKNGLFVDDDACEEILDLVENNTQALKSECSRFFAVFEKGTRVTVQNVDQLIEHNREESAFTLFDAMAQGSKPAPERLETALGILQKIRLSKDSSSVALIAGLSYCFRRLLAWHNLQKAGKTDDFSLKTNGFSSKKSRKQFTEAARVWTAGQGAAILGLLSRADMGIRSSGSALEDTILQTLVYSITVKKGASPAVWEDGWPA